MTLIEFYNHVRDPHHFPAPVVTPSADILAALEFLIRQYASTSGSGIVSVNRSFFLPETKTAVQKSVLDMMKGVYGSVRYVKEDPGVAINVDMSHGVFYPKGELWFGLLGDGSAVPRLSSSLTLLHFLSFLRRPAFADHYAVPPTSSQAIYLE